MSNIVITRRELLELWNGLPILSDLKGFKLSYAVARTKAKLRPEVEALEEALKPNKDYQAYEEKRLVLCRKYVQKDAQGNPVIQGDQFVFGENREAFDAEMEPLGLEYTAAIAGRLKQIEDYTSSMKEKITVEIHQVVEVDVPGDVTVGQMAVLHHLIKAE